MPCDRESLQALRNIIEETDLLISTTTPLPEIHRTIRVTPAMEAGITNHVWDLAELLG